MPTKTQEQQDRFVDHIQPMPVPAALVERIRKESEYAKQLAAQILNAQDTPIRAIY